VRGHVRGPGLRRRVVSGEDHPMLVLFGYDPGQRCATRKVLEPSDRFSRRGEVRQGQWPRSTRGGFDAGSAGGRGAQAAGRRYCDGIHGHCPVTALECLAEFDVRNNA